MTVFQGIFLSEGTPEGRGPQPQDTPAGRAARSQPSNSTLQPSFHQNEYVRFLSFQFQYLLTYYPRSLDTLQASAP